MQFDIKNRRFRNQLIPNLLPRSFRVQLVLTKHFIRKNNTKRKERQEKEFTNAAKLYNVNFLSRLLRLVEVFTSIAICSSHPMQLVQRVTSPQ